MAFEGKEAFATWSSAQMVTSVAVLDGQLQVGSRRPVNEPTLFVEHVSEETRPHHRDPLVDSPVRHAVA
jgi:hypothetical protein